MSILGGATTVLFSVCARYFCPSAPFTRMLSLLACAVCGLSVGIMWPGTFSKAAAVMPLGGTAMFALLALGGDLGCSGGPTLVGFVASSLGDNLKLGILAGILFPVLLLGGIFLTGRFVKKDNGGKGVEA